MSSEDLKRICGMAEEENNFPNLNTLDLEFADFTNDADLINLSHMDNLKTITFSTYNDKYSAILSYEWFMQNRTCHHS